jgi:hypothetical protein
MIPGSMNPHLYKKRKGGPPATALRKIGSVPSVPAFFVPAFFRVPAFFPAFFVLDKPRVGQPYFSVFVLLREGVRQPPSVRLCFSVLAVLFNSTKPGFHLLELLFEFVYPRGNVVNHTAFVMSLHPLRNSFVAALKLSIICLCE